MQKQVDETHKRERDWWICGGTAEPAELRYVYDVKYIIVKNVEFRISLLRRSL